MSANFPIKDCRHIFAAAVILLLCLLGACAQGPDNQAGPEAQEHEKFKALVELFGPGAERGDADSQFILGVAYFSRTARGETDRMKDAVVWLRHAADQGHVWSQTLLSGLYVAGKGIPRNYSEATRWAAEAARQGHPWAMGLLGKIVFQGLGVSADRVRGYALLILADRNGKTIPLIFPPAVANAIPDDEQARLVEQIRSVGQVISRFRETLKERMTPDEVGAAMRLADDSKAMDGLLLDMSRQRSASRAAGGVAL